MITVNGSSTPVACNLEGLFGIVLGVTWPFKDLFTLSALYQNEMQKCCSRTIICIYDYVYLLRFQTRRETRTNNNELEGSNKNDTSRITYK